MINVCSVIFEDICTCLKLRCDHIIQALQNIDGSKRPQIYGYRKYNLN